VGSVWRKLEKVLKITGYKKYLEKYWRAATFTMKNLKTGKTTILKYGPYKFRTGLTVARTIIRAHGGDIALINRHGGGVRVMVTFPR